MADQTPPTVLEDISAMYRTNYMGLASFTMLIWDHIDTFGTEVEYIWKGRKGLPYLSPVWTPSTRNRFIRFEGAMTVIGINIVAIMMYLRVYALYSRQKIILGIVIFIYLCQLSMNAWLLTHGEAVVHNELSGVLACTMIFDPKIPYMFTSFSVDRSVLASSSAWLPLLYDTVVLGLTLNRTLPSLRNRNASFIMKRLLEDGLIYYSAIFGVTAVLTIMIIAAPPGLKNITAQLELLLTVAMMSRITLNLKKSVGKAKAAGIHAEVPSNFTRQSHFSVVSDLKIVTPNFTHGRNRSASLPTKGKPMVRIPGRSVDSRRSSLDSESPIMDPWANVDTLDGINDSQTIDQPPHDSASKVGT